jgi:hypothetical protein
VSGHIFRFGTIQSSNMQIFSMLAVPAHGACSKEQRTEEWRILIKNKTRAGDRTIIPPARRSSRCLSAAREIKNKYNRISSRCNRISRRGSRGESPALFATMFACVRYGVHRACRVWVGHKPMWLQSKETMSTRVDNPRPGVNRGQESAVSMSSSMMCPNCLKSFHYSIFEEGNACLRSGSTLAGAPDRKRARRARLSA